MDDTMTTPNPSELMERLRNVKFPHTVRGDIALGSLLLAHSGFICLIPELDAAMLDELRAKKKDLDILGILIIIVTKKSLEDKEILIIGAPEIIEKYAPSKGLFLFIEEKLRKALIVTSPEDFLGIAADHIELDDQSRKHVTANILKALQKKGKLMDEKPIEDEPVCRGKCSGCGS
jgi:hypothetical protein